MIAVGSGIAERTSDACDANGARLTVIRTWERNARRVRSRLKKATKQGDSEAEWALWKRLNAPGVLHQLDRFRPRRR
jgi:hypothetical protein